MKPFKFRVWDCDNARWSEEDYSISQTGELFVDLGCHASKEIPDLKNFEISYSTGLFDKNGHEIFEGDLLKYDQDGSLNLIIFDKECARFMLGDEEISSVQVLEIIDNKYENPELLEKIK